MCGSSSSFAEGGEAKRGTWATSEWFRKLLGGGHVFLILLNFGFGRVRVCVCSGEIAFSMIRLEVAFPCFNSSGGEELWVIARCRGDFSNRSWGHWFSPPLKCSSLGLEVVLRATNLNKNKSVLQLVGKVLVFASVFLQPCCCCTGSCPHGKQLICTAEGLSSDAVMGANP